MCIKTNIRYIPVPTGNSCSESYSINLITVYPCTYRELAPNLCFTSFRYGISLYLQGTRIAPAICLHLCRYIPVPTGNSYSPSMYLSSNTVYPCTYRELADNFITIETNSGISLYLQGTQHWELFCFLFSRYIPVPTGNSNFRYW